MPQVFVYIRQDDYDKWKSIEKKSEFIHNALTSVMPTPMNKIMGTSSPVVGKPFKTPKVIKTKQDAVEVIEENFPEAKPTTYKKTSNWGA